MPTNTNNRSNSGGTSFTPATPKRFDSLGLVFDCICIEIRTDLSDNLLNIATNVVRNVLGNSWLVEATDDDHEFDVTCSTISFAYRQYWEFCYQLLRHADVVFAYPEFEPPTVPEDAVSQSGLQIGYVRALSYTVDGNEADPALTTDKEWALKQCKVPEAWKLIRDVGKKPGEGIVIGHPDLGYRHHSEMDQDRIDRNLQWDFVRNVRDPVTPNGDHGLGTASVLMSGETGDLKGPALHSVIVPLRVKKEGVVLGYRESYRRLRRALVYSEDHNFDIISISLGGGRASYRRRVRKRLIKLNRKGVIIVAAAGNRAQFGHRFTFDAVVYPARWPETVAVAASTVERTSWVGSCRGAAVDISAPGDSVWRAIYEDNSPTMVRSAGTSFATATVAGIAAIWRSYRRTELASVSKRKIPRLFKRLMKETAQTEHNLFDNAGAGIIDAHALLNAEIPDMRDEEDIPPIVDEVNLPGIADTIGLLEPDLRSLQSLSESNLENINTFEAYELETALDLEMWYNATKRNPQQSSILQEFSPTLASKLQGEQD